MKSPTFTARELNLILELECSLAERYPGHCMGGRALLVCVLYADMLISGVPPDMLRALAMGLVDGADQELAAVRELLS